MTKVSLVRTGDRTAGARRALELLKINPLKGKSVVLKPNFNSADPTPGSTHIETLRSLILTLKDMGAKKITLAERSGPGDTTAHILELKGAVALAQEIGFDIVNLQELPRDGWVLVKPTDSHWKDGFLFPRIYKEAEAIVTTCCLKTHQYGGHFTLSMKLSVGMVPPGLGQSSGYPYMNELHSSKFQRQLIAEINTAYSPDLVLLDGVDAFVDGGPARGKRVKADVMIAGTDRIAIDATGVAILRSLGTTPEVTHGKIFEQDQIKRAVELWLGVKSAGEIQFLTGDKESATYAADIKKILAKG